MNNWKIFKESFFVVTIPLIISLSMMVFFWFILQWVVESMVSIDEITTDEMMKNYELVKTLAFWTPIAIGTFSSIRPILTMLDFMAGLSNVRNIEKRTNMLKKMGVEKFIEATEAILIDGNDRGIELYSSDKIIEGKVVKFLIYRDTSTNEPYISYVKPSCNTADEGMAWKHHLTVEQYRRLKIEA